MFNTILVSDQDAVRTITINRGAKLNALNRETLLELRNALGKALHDAAIGVIIITGSGSKAFVAGADISEFSSFGYDEARKLAEEAHQQIFDLIQNFPKPVIAAINGFALGGGLELAMSCHIRIAGRSAKLGLPEVSLGLIPGYGGTQRLAQLVGRGRALEMILTGDMIDAEAAWRIGLVNHVTESDELIPFTKTMAKKILARSPGAVARAIKAVNAAFDKDTNGFDVEISEFAACFGTEDFNEGISAFMNKRNPNFKR